MNKVELTEEVVRRLLRAYLREQPMLYNVRLAMRCAEQITREAVEAEFAELENHYWNEALS